MIPSRRLLAALAAWALLGLGASLGPNLGPRLGPALVSAFTLAGLALAAAALLDLALVFLLPGPACARTVPASLALGAWRQVDLTLENPSPLPVTVRVFDHHPGDFQSRGLPFTHRIPGRGALAASYRVRPCFRGRRAFGPVQVRLATPAGLWWRALKVPAPFPVNVYPDFKALARYALLATDQRLSLLGILKRPRRGEGLDFHQLRDYRQGDTLRQIDWKASSRSPRLISREYQDERDQQVLFLLDCGRTMRPLDGLEAGRVGHFDQALNALFLLAYVALKQGDAVGVATFAEEGRRALAPRKGTAALEGLFQGLFDVQPTSHAHDYLAAARDFLARFRRRALVVVLTNLRDEVDATLLPALELLRSRHLVILANLRESSVDDLLQEPVHDLEGAALHGAAHDYLARRRDTFRRIADSGARVLDVLPAQLPTALVNRYLEMKAGGVI